MLKNTGSPTYTIPIYLTFSQYAVTILNPNSYNNSNSQIITGTLSKIVLYDYNNFYLLATKVKSTYN